MKFEYDSTLAEETKTYERLPAGTYKVFVDDCSVVETKAGDGIMIKVEMSVIEGDRKGAKIFANHLTKHSSDVALKIAAEKLNQLAYAVGVPEGGRLNDTDMVAGKIFCVKIRYNKKDEQDIVAYSKTGEQSPPGEEPVTPKGGDQPSKATADSDW